jgi:hypothetical protein
MSTEVENKATLVRFFRNVSKKISRVSEATYMGRPTGLQFISEPGEGNEPFHSMGVKVENLFLNLNFYGLKPEDLGYTHTFNVEVYEKKADNGITYTHVDFLKVNAEPVAKFKLNIDFPELGGDVQIKGTNSFVCIVPRKKNVEYIAFLNGMRNELLKIESETGLDRKIDEFVEELHRDVDKKIAASVL